MRYEVEVNEIFDEIIQLTPLEILAAVALFLLSQSTAFAGGQVPYLAKL